MGDSRVPNATTDCRPDTGRGGGFCGHHGSCLGPYLRRCRRMQISNQASLRGSPSAHGIFLHIPPRTSFISVPASRACCAEWRDAARIHHFEVRKAVGRKPDGPVARPHKESMPSAARAWPRQLVLRTPQLRRSSLPISMEPRFCAKGDSRQH